MKKRIILNLLSGLLILAIAGLSFFAAFAADSRYSLTLNCSVIVNGQSQPVSGDTFAAVKLADCKITKNEKSHILKYNTLKRFSSYDCNWSKLSSSKLRIIAKRIAENVTKKDYVDIKTTDKNGNLTFRLKDKGLYLILRTKITDSSIDFDPFIVGIPQVIDKKLIKNITATPKFRSSITTDDPSKNDDAHKYVDERGGGHLPQTGQPILPIIIFIVAGVPLIIIGAYLLKSGRKNEED